MTSRTSSSARLRSSVGAILAAAVVGLTACNGAGTPTGAQATSPAPGPSTSASVTQGPAPTPAPAYKPADAKGKAQNVPVPVLPEAAKAETKEGLEAFAKYWYELLNYAYETGDTAEWAKLASTSCEFCATVKNSIETGYKSSRWQVGGRIMTPQIEANMAGTAPQVVVQVVQETTSYYKADGTPGRAPEPESNTASVVIAGYQDGAWKVSDMHLLR